MITDYKVTELFCIIDEFCKHFDAENAENLLEDNSGVKRRRRAASLSDSEIMTILLYFHFGTFRNFKHYYLFFIKGTMKSYFGSSRISGAWIFRKVLNLQHENCRCNMDVPSRWLERTVRDSPVRTN